MLELLEGLKPLINSFGPYLGFFLFIFLRDMYVNTKQREKEEKRIEAQTKEDLAREQRLGARLDKITDDHNNMITTVIRENSIAMNSMAESNRHLAEMIGRK